MALVLANRVQESATANTTVSFSLAGATTGYQAFSSAIGNANTTYYGASDGTNWEVGVGTYATSGNLLNRTTILSSSVGGTTAATFSGSVTVFCDYPAGNAVVSSNNPGTSGYVLTSNGTGVAPTWQVSGGGGSPGGSTTQVQYNNAGAFAGSANMTFNGTSLTLANDATINGLTVGKGTSGGSNNTVLGTSALTGATSNNTTAIGYQAGKSLNTSQTYGSVYVGYQAGSLSTGTDNTYIGSNVVNTNASSGSNNVVVGAVSATNLTSANSSTILGYSAGYNLQTGSNNTLLGNSILFYSFAGTYNTFVGDSAGKGSGFATQNYNVGVGAQTQYSMTTASNNSSLGYQSLYSTTTGGNNVAIGYQSSYSNVVATSNVSIGYQSLQNANASASAISTTTGGSGYNGGGGSGTYFSNVQTSYVSGPTAAVYPTVTVSVTSGVLTYSFNNTNGSGFTGTGTVLGITSAAMVAAGAAAGGSGATFTVIGLNTNGSNVAIGAQTLGGNGTPSYNVAIGQFALSSSNGVNNVAVGTFSLQNANIGFNNTAIGPYSLSSATSGAYNVALGYQSLYSVTFQNNITGVGYQAGYSLTASDTYSSTYVGYQAGYYNTTGADNVFLGGKAGYGVSGSTTGGKNVAIGGNAMGVYTTGANNVAIGYQAGNTLTTGSNNILLGYQSAPSAITVSNEITIGNSSNTVIRYPHNYSTVASLPSATTVGRGSRTFVTDALSPTFQSTVTGGGAVFTPVYSDGTNWKVG